MNEIACSFGEDSQLTGVYTPAKSAQHDKPCLLFLTAGLLHHVGPTRLHVQMARAFADDNVACLRFDLSGVGDSETSALGGYFQERSVSEVQQALEYLQREHGHTSFVLVGLCSGADDALAAAAKNQRVVGLVLLNGYAYRAGFFWPFRFLKYYLPRLLMTDKIIGRLQRVVRRMMINDEPGHAADQQALDVLDNDYRYVPPQEEAGALLSRLMQEQTNMLLVYTGSEYDDYLYEGQLFAMFPQLKNSEYVKEHYAQMADHTFTLDSDRENLTAQVRAWYAQAQFNRLPVEN